MNKQERERFIALLARIGAEMEDASAVAIGAAALDGEELAGAVGAVLDAVGRIEGIALQLP